MSNGIVKCHHAIMKMDALHDYDLVCALLKTQKRADQIVKPKGKSTHKIEDATAIMLKNMQGECRLTLRRGLSYYFSI